MDWLKQLPDLIALNLLALLYLAPFFAVVWYIRHRLRAQERLMQADGRMPLSDDVPATGAGAMAGFRRAYLRCRFQLRNLYIAFLFLYLYLVLTEIEWSGGVGRHTMVYLFFGVPVTIGWLVAYGLTHRRWYLDLPFAVALLAIHCGWTVRLFRFKYRAWLDLLSGAAS